MVEQEDISELASDIAHVFAYIHYNQIPKEIFRRASDTIVSLESDDDYIIHLHHALARPLLDMLTARCDG